MSNEKVVEPQRRCRWCNNSLHLYGQFYICMKHTSSVVQADGTKEKERRRVLGDDRCKKFRFNVHKYNMVMKPADGAQV